MLLSQYGKQVSFTLPALKQIKILIPNGNQLSSPFTYAYPFNLGNTVYKKQALTFYIQVSLKHKTGSYSMQFSSPGSPEVTRCLSGISAFLGACKHGEGSCPSVAFSTAEHCKATYTVLLDRTVVLCKVFPLQTEPSFLRL